MYIGVRMVNRVRLSDCASLRSKHKATKNPRSTTGGLLPAAITHNGKIETNSETKEKSP